MKVQIGPAGLGKGSLRIDHQYLGDNPQTQVQVLMLTKKTHKKAHNKVGFVRVFFYVLMWMLRSSSADYRSSVNLPHNQQFISFLTH